MNHHIQYQLIELYCHVSDEYYNTLCVEMQRLSNNHTPKFSDEEVLATYLWGLLQGMRTVKAVYNHIKDYFLEFFPKIPSYQAYSRRLNLLLPALTKYAGILMEKASELPGVLQQFSLVDSFPIIVASGKRKKTAKVARECCGEGYCAAKDMHFYGLRLHTLAFRRMGKIPVPETFQITSADTHDLTAMRQVFSELDHRYIYADKAYLNKEFWESLAERNVCLLTPRKRKKGETQWEAHFSKASDDLWSKAVSSVRQPIESFFNWIQYHFDLQHASKVRSSVGLYVFVIARLAAAVLALLK